MLNRDVQHNRPGVNAGDLRFIYEPNRFGFIRPTPTVNTAVWLLDNPQYRPVVNRRGVVLVVLGLILLAGLLVRIAIK